MKRSESDIYSTPAPYLRELPTTPRAAGGSPFSPAARTLPRGSGRRTYDFAGSSRLTDDLNVFDLGPDGAISGLGVMRNRARYLATNNPWLKKFLFLQRRNVIGGQGIRLKSRAKDPNGVYDDFANKLQDQKWETWGRKENASLDREFSLRLLDCENIENYFRDGEILLRKVRGADNPFRFALQVLDPALLDETLNSEPTSDHGRIRLGIELDDNNVKTHFWIKQQTYGSPVGNIGRHVRIPANEIIHWYKRERPSQIRGVTWFATPGQRSQMLDKIEEAITIGTRIGASQMGFFKPGEDYNAPTDKDGNPIENFGSVPTDCAPGEFWELPEGLEFESFNPDYPGADIPEFTKSILRGIACGLGISYFALVADLREANYSSLQQGGQDDRDAYRETQITYIEQVRSDYHRAWLEMAIVTGQFNLPFAKLDKWLMVKHLPRGWRHIDPLKGSRGNEIDLQNNKTMSRSRICAERGDDFEEIVEELAAEKKLLAELGLNDTEYDQMTAENTDTLINKDD